MLVVIPASETFHSINAKGQVRADPTILPLVKQHYDVWFPEATVTYMQLHVAVV